MASERVTPADIARARERVAEWRYEHQDGDADLLERALDEVEALNAALQAVALAGTTPQRQETQEALREVLDCEECRLCKSDRRAIDSALGGL